MSKPHFGMHSFLRKPVHFSGLGIAPGSNWLAPSDDNLQHTRVAMVANGHDTYGGLSK